MRPQRKQKEWKSPRTLTVSVESSTAAAQAQPPPSSTEEVESRVQQSYSEQELQGLRELFRGMGPDEVHGAVDVRQFCTGFKEYLGSRGHDMPDANLMWCAFREADFEGRGVICFSEFCTAVLSGNVSEVWGLVRAHVNRASPPEEHQAAPTPLPQAKKSSSSQMSELVSFFMCVENGVELDMCASLSAQHDDAGTCCAGASTDNDAVRASGDCGDSSSASLPTGCS